MHSHTSRDNLPLVLNAQTVAEILGVSLAVAYRFFDREDFPTIRVGVRRKLVSRDAFFEWLDHQA